MGSLLAMAKNGVSRSKRHGVLQATAKFVECYTPQICDLIIKAFKSDCARDQECACAIVEEKGSTPSRLAPPSTGSLANTIRIKHSAAAAGAEASVGAAVACDECGRGRRAACSVRCGTVVRLEATMASPPLSIKPRYATSNDTVTVCPVKQAIAKHFTCEPSWMTQCLIAHFQNACTKNWIVQAIYDRVVTATDPHVDTTWKASWPKIKRALMLHLHSDHYQSTRGNERSVWESLYTYLIPVLDNIEPDRDSQNRKCPALRCNTRTYRIVRMAHDAPDGCPCEFLRHSRISH
jgi:hypothetical protein